MKSQKLPVGMVGVGGFGAHRRGWMRETGLFDLVAVHDYNPEAMGQAAEEDGARPVPSYEELLAVESLQAMIISSGAGFHAEQAIAALHQGLHVFIEKPLASTMEEVRAILAVQRETGLVVGCGHRDHSSEAFSRTVKHLIDSGELGKLVTFEASTGHSGGFHIRTGDWRSSRERNPGGMLFQCGVHKLHELIYYFGPVRRIRSVMRYDLHETETADVAMCQVEFESGLTGTLNAYHITPCLQSLMIAGTRAAIFKDERPWPGEYGEWIQHVPVNMDGSIEARIPLETDGKEDKCGNLRSFYKAITEGAVAYPSALDGARSLAPIFAAVEAAENDTWINVETFA